MQPSEGSKPSEGSDKEKDIVWASSKLPAIPKRLRDGFAEVFPGSLAALRTNSMKDIAMTANRICHCEER